MLQKISIFAFRGVHGKHYEFFNGIHLIKGPSGSGKSTIFEAIRWCLFGNIKNIGKNPKVSLYFSSCDVSEIHRSKGRKNVTVNYKGKVLESEEAQEVIHKVFGPDDLWQYSTYHIQGEHSELIRDSTRRDILLRVIFEHENMNPFELIKKIRKLKKEKEILLGFLEKQLDPNGKYKPVPSHNPEKIKEKRGHLGKLRYELQEIQKIKRPIGEELLGKITEIVHKFGLEKVKKTVKNISQELVDYIRSNLETLKKVKRPVDYFPPEIYPIYNGNIKYMRSLPVKTQKNLLKFRDTEECKRLVENTEKIKELGIKRVKDALTLCEPPILTEEQCRNLLYSIDHYEKSLEMAKRMGVTLENIDEEIKRLTERIEFCRDYPLLTEELKNKNPQKVYECPRCHEMLMLKQEKLEVVNEKNIKQRIREIKARLKKMEDPEKLKKRYEQLLSVPKATKPEYTVEFVQKQLKLIENQKILNSLHLLRTPELKPLNFLNFLDLLDFLPFLSGITEELIESRISNEGMSSIEYLKSLGIEKIDPLFFEALKYRDIYDLLDSYEELSRNTDIIENFDSYRRYRELRKEEIVRKEIQELEEEIKRIEEDMEQEKFNQKWEEYMQTKRDFDALQRLFVAAENSEMEQTEDVLNHFNIFVNSFLNQVFPEISLIFHIDTVEINYKGVSHFSSLSGGEKDRVSLALLIAMYKLRNRNSFLLLDECFSSLDAQTRETCFEALKKLNLNQVLCVSHDDPEEFFDHVVYV